MTTLSDNELEDEFRQGNLIKNPNSDMLDGSSYELRMGDVYYDLTEAGKRFKLDAGEKVLIKPGHRVVLITEEELDTPADIAVRVVSKGSLFAVGLSPVATYADPGFRGKLGIVTQNISDKYIELPQGEPIAKAEFGELTSEAKRVYQGQHGFQTEIWPIKTHLQKTHAEVAGDRRVKSEKEEALNLLPAATAIVIRRMEATQFWTNIGLFVAIVLNALLILLVNEKVIEGLIGIVTSLIGTAVIAIGTQLIKYFRGS